MQELSGRMGSLGFMLDAEELQTMISDCDGRCEPTSCLLSDNLDAANANGKIEFDEFKKLMQLPQYSGFAARMLHIRPAVIEEAAAPSRTQVHGRGRSPQREPQSDRPTRDRERSPSPAGGEAEDAEGIA